jgi:hypothetical protein
LNKIQSGETILVDGNPCLTPSKPAGTIHIIDGNLIGDIATFYKQIFLKVPNLDEFLLKTELIDLPIRTKTNQNQNEHLSIHIGQNIFVDYSSNQIKSNLFSSTNSNSKLISTDSKTKNSANSLSSSIQAGQYLPFYYQKISNLERRTLFSFPTTSIPTLFWPISVPYNNA